VITCLRQQMFTLLLFAAVVLACIWPEPVLAERARWADALADFAVVLIFLLQGLSLAMRQLLAGARPLRLHAFVMGWNFLFFPLLVALLLASAGDLLLPELRAGLWMLAILPTTIASATTFTVAAGGGSAQAIFASVFSNLLAVLVVPLLALAYLSRASGLELPLLPLFKTLAVLVVLPLAAGQLIRRGFHTFAIGMGARTRGLPQLAILYIVYRSFAQSVAAGVWESLSGLHLAAVGLLVALLLVIISWLVWRTSGWMQFTPKQQVAAFFTASQKSMATGLPLLTAILSAAAWPGAPGLILVPLLIYHPLQLLLAGLWLPRIAARTNAP